MHRLLALILIAAVLWGGWWVLGSRGADRAFQTWLEERRTAGWVAEVSDLSVQGFPNRFDTTFTDLRLADPATGWAWDAPFFQLLALSYQPNHIIAVWPPNSQLATPLEKFDLTSADLRASLKEDASTSLAIDRATLVSDSLTITAASTGEATRMSALRAAIERSPSAPTDYRIGLSAEGLSLPPRLRALLGAGSDLPDSFSAFNADLTASCDRPWDRRALETIRPQPTALTLRIAEAKWGALELALAGDLTLTDGTPEGRLTIKARNWQEILTMARSADLLSPALATQAESVLGMLARAGGNPKTLDLPLDFKRGMLFIGPIPVAPAPRIFLR